MWDYSDIMSRVYKTRCGNLGDRGSRLGPKVGQIDTKWDKFERPYLGLNLTSVLKNWQMFWNLIWKSPGFIPFGAFLTHFEAKPTIPAVDKSAVWDVWVMGCSDVGNKTLPHTHYTFTYGGSLLIGSYILIILHKSYNVVGLRFSL